MKLTRKIKKVQDDLKAMVEAEYRYAVPVSVREEPGPLGLKVIVACNPKAHPGTGMRRVLMDTDGTTYGVHGEKNMGELFRKMGWMESTPDAASFLKLVNQGCFDGIGKFSPSETDARFLKKGNGLEFHFIKIEHPSGKRVGQVLPLP